MKRSNETQSGKVLVTLDQDTIDQIDVLVTKNGSSRSAECRQMILQWLRDHSEGTKRPKIKRGHQR